MKTKTFLSIALFIFISSCAYFNTFYNAKKMFREAQKIELDDKGRAKPNAVQKYNNAIKKCGVILTEYKDSKWADDALFLLARCLYYTGTNYIQTIEKLDDLIKFYPESKFIPEAYIYRAKAKYEFNKKEEAFSELNDYINNPDFVDYYAKAMKVLADFYLEEENYVKAQSNLQTIITRFPKSDLFADAYFASGKTYHESENYEQSNAVFFPLLKSRVAKKLKLNARYYIIQNYLELEEFQKAYNTSLELLKKEYRTDRIPDAQILKARSLAGVGKYEDSIELFLNLIETNKKSRISAEASYYLAETYFIQLQDYEKAIEYYNNVKTEYNRSEYVEDSISRSAVASQIIQYNNPDYSIPVEDLVNQQFKLAEFYIDVLEQPDSALSVYNNIIEQDIILKTQLDSLYSALEQLENVEESPDHAFEDSLAIISDSLYTVSDSLPELNDSLAVKQDSLHLDPKTEITNRITKIEENIKKYENDFIPKAIYIKVWIYLKILNDQENAQSEFEILKNTLPDNKYTYAADMLLQGKDYELISYTEKSEFEEYEQAISQLESDPIHTVKALKEIIKNREHNFYLKSLYTLGYLNYFLLNDSLEAKKYFNILLNQDVDNEYKDNLDRFYSGSHFIKTEKIVVELESEKPEEEDSTQDQEKDKETEIKPLTEEEIIDSLKTEKSEELEPKIENKNVTIITKNDLIIESDKAGNIINMFLELYVNSRGQLDSLSILNPASKDSTKVKLDLLEQIRTWEFSPAYKAGEAVDSSLRLPVKIEYE